MTFSDAASHIFELSIFCMRGVFKEFSRRTNFSQVHGFFRKNIRGSLQFFWYITDLEQIVFCEYYRSSTLKFYTTKKWSTLKRVLGRRMHYDSWCQSLFFVKFS